MSVWPFPCDLQFFHFASQQRYLLHSRFCCWYVFLPSPHRACLTYLVPYNMSCLNTLGCEREVQFYDKMLLAEFLLNSAMAWLCCMCLWWVLYIAVVCIYLFTYLCCSCIYFVGFSIHVWVLYVALMGLMLFLEAKTLWLLEYIFNNWLLKQKWQSFVITTMLYCICLFWTLLLDKSLLF